MDIVISSMSLPKKYWATNKLRSSSLRILRYYITTNLVIYTGHILWNMNGVGEDNADIILGGKRLCKYQVDK